MASIETRQRGGKDVFTVRWRDGSGGQKRKTFATKSAAKTFVATVTADLARGTYIDPHAGKQTLADYSIEWLASQTSDASTREAVELRLRKHILPHLGAFQLQAIKPSRVQAWVARLQADLAPRTVRVIHATLSAVLAAAVVDELIPRNPCRSVKLPKPDASRAEPWTLQQVAAVSAALPERYAVMLMLGVGCGLRQGEIFGLAVDDVDFLRGVIHVRRQVKIVGAKQVFGSTKNGQVRDVPLPNAVAQALAAHLAAYPAVTVELPWEVPTATARSASLILSTRERTALQRNYINLKVWKPALREAGIPATRENGMHVLRHTYASVLLDAGESVRALSEYLGHADAGFTLRTYTHLMPTSDQRTKKAVDAALDFSSAVADGLPRAQAVPNP